MWQKPLKINQLMLNASIANSMVMIFFHKITIRINIEITVREKIYFACHRNGGNYLEVSMQSHRYMIMCGKKLSSIIVFKNILMLI